MLVAWFLLIPHYFVCRFLRHCLSVRVYLCPNPASPINPRKKKHFTLAINLGKIKTIFDLFFFDKCVYACDSSDSSHTWVRTWGIPGYPPLILQWWDQRFRLNGHAKSREQGFFPASWEIKNYQSKTILLFWKKIIHLVAKCYIFWDGIEKQN